MLQQTLQHFRSIHAAEVGRITFLDRAQNKNTTKS
jgi:hypothetical protein